MKILFDESVPKQLRRLLGRDDITLLEELGWKGIKNGVLLSRAEDHGFQILITADQHFRHQQNLTARRIAIVVLPYNRRKWMPRLLPALQKALDEVAPGSYIKIPSPLE